MTAEKRRRLTKQERQAQLAKIFEITLVLEEPEVITPEYELQMQLADERLAALAERALLAYAKNIVRQRAQLPNEPLSNDKCSGDLDSHTEPDEASEDDQDSSS